MNTALRFFAIGFQLSASRAISCSLPFKNINDVCLNVTFTEQKWCEAQAYCMSIGGELIQGKTYRAINNKRVSGMPNNYWVGLTDLLHERRSNRDGWLWTSGSAEPSSSTFIWNSNDPGKPFNGGQDYGGSCFGRGVLCDFRYSNKLAAVCQPKAVPPISSGPAVEFEEAAIPTGLVGVQFAEENGCSQLISKVEFTECAVLCAMEPNQRCVSFYHNEAKRQCHLVSYTDATLSVSGAGVWKKFVRK